MTPNTDLETKVIKRFITKAKQDRYIQFVLTPKNRQKFINDLSDVSFLSLEKFDKVNGDEQQIILTTLQKNKVADKSCYVISENTKLDTKTLDTKEAISDTVGHGMGTILVFGDADIIYYECETMNIRYISKMR